MKPRWPSPLVLGAAGFLGAALFLGTLTELRGRFLGIEYVDAYGTQWFYWYAGRQLLAGEGFGWTDLFFFPHGKDVFLHTGSNVLDAILAVPFLGLFGHVLGYNLFVLSALVASGAAIARLVREVAGDAEAAGVAAVLATASPYVLTEVGEGRPTQAFLAFPALYLLYLWRSGTTAGWRSPLLGGLFLALCGYQYWYYAFFGGMVGLAHGAWRTALPAPGAGGRLAVFGRHALLAIVGIGLCLPAGLRLWRSSEDGAIPGLLDTSDWTRAHIVPHTAEGEPIGLFLWQPFADLSGFLAASDTGGALFLPQGDLSPAIAGILLLLALIRPGRLDRGPLLAMLATTELLAMGPLVVLGQGWLPNAPYLALLDTLSFLKRLWWPARACAFTTLLNALAAGAALAWIFAANRRYRVAVVAVAAGAQAWHLHRGRLLPFPTWESDVPAGYRCLAQATEGAVIELPFSWTQAHLYYQTVHGRPILGGMIENNPVFAPAEAVALREGNTWLAALLDLSRSVDDEPKAWTEADKQAIGDLGYRYVLLQRDAFALETSAPGLADNAVRLRLRRMRSALGQMLGPPVYEDARINLYSPWGHPPPCDPATLEKDEVARGNTEAVHGLRALAAPEETALEALLPAPAASAGEAAQQPADEFTDRPAAAVP